MAIIKTVVCQQPIGNLYLFTLRMSDLTPLVQVKRRKDSGAFVQRERSKAREKVIAKYSNTVDACIPSNILVNIDASKVKVLGNTLELEAVPGVFEILDGQNRIGGFSQSSFDYDVPIGAFIGLSDKQKARVFKSINYNAKQVCKSHVYDLLSLTEDGSEGEALAHEIVKLLNNSEQSPFKGQIKMLGSGKGWFNQAAMLKPLALIIDNGCLKNVDGGDAYSCLLSYFKAWYQVFGIEFTTDRVKNSLLPKSFGVQVMLGMFPRLYGACHKVDGSDYDRFLVAVQNFDGVQWTKESMNGDTSKNGIKIKINELMGRL